MSEQEQKGLFRNKDRVELIATVIMALAAILTAWAAFESAKWSGVQATSFAQAGAARTESTRFDLLGSQQSAVDVQTFLSFASAAADEIGQGTLVLEPGVPYTPQAGSLSGFLYERVRPEFKPALDAWLTEFINDRANAPSTPFEMDEYVVVNRLTAADFLAESGLKADAAAEANQTSDNYVLVVVAFALVLFFLGVSAKLVAIRNQHLAIAVATAIFLGATIVLFSLPKIWPWMP
jgi:hypothetical protein